MTLLVRGGLVWTGDGLTDQPTDLVVGDDGRIASLGAAPTDADATVLDAAGCWVLPGLVDIHVHMREPGGEEAETVASASAAAAAGGFTDVVAMGNTSPPHDSAATVRLVRTLGEAAGLVRVHPAGCVTRGREGDALTDLLELHAAGCTIFTDDGDPVGDAMLLRRALEYVKAFDGVIADHCEERSLTRGAQMHEGTVSGRLGLAGWPSAAEEIIVARDIVLAEFTGSRIHLQHVSTEGSVELLRAAKGRGVKVSAEVTPHHLTLTDERAATFDPVYKVNPPIRSERHVAAVRAALADGTIDAVATDHAPHPPDRKDEWTSASCGMLGLETALALVHGLVADGMLGIERLVDAMAVRPAAIAGLGTRGTLEQGTVADLCIFDPDAHWAVDPALLQSKSRNTPYAGMELRGKVRHTVFAGAPTYLDGAVVSPTVAA